MTTTRPPAAPSLDLLARLVASALAIAGCAYLAFYLAAVALMTCFGGCSATDELVGWLVGCCSAALLALGPLAAGRLLGGRAWAWLATGVLVIGAGGWAYMLLAGS